LANNLAYEQKLVFDVNALAIFLVKDHPGCKYVSPIVEKGLRGVYTPAVMDILPMRAYWIMTRKWGCPEKESSAAIKYFITEYDKPSYTSLKKETIVNGFKLAEKLNHDPFDCLYLAYAQQENAKGILSTDTDFEKLCNQIGLEYINPVPKEVLKQFKEQNK
jgi:predicted nucleic acid-binding protein